MRQFITLAVFVLCFPVTSDAQSGDKPSGSVKTPPDSQGSDKVGAEMKPAMQGYCPVCILKMKKWVQGDPQFSSTFDGQLYLFPGAEQKQMFDAEPAAYAPVLGGDCIVAFKKMGKRVPGDMQHAAVHQDRLFLFSNAMAKEEFLKTSEDYVNADIAIDGRCTVCKVEMDKDVEGNPEIAVVYRGLRYFFPDDEQRKMFVANPAKYAISAKTPANQRNQNTGNANKGSSGK